MQMYKIYINDTPLVLADTAEISSETGNDRYLIARYPGKPKFLFNYIDMLEKGKRFDSVMLYSDDLQQLWADFVAQYKLIEAAGGVVFNLEGKVLLIFRRGFWDLPKGKIDPGESIEAAALREVQEETGLQQLELKAQLAETYHAYREGKQRILKCTHWFIMQTAENILTPQTDEGIEKAVWQDVTTFLSGKPIMYSNIREVLVKISQQKS